MAHVQRTGRFLCLEGPDGAGKSTQAARLAESLRADGHEVVTCRDPGGTPLGDRLRSILQDRSDLRFGMTAEMLLFMASRAQLVEEVIRPALARGAVVVSDRFLLSNVVYQGCAGGLDPSDLRRVGEVATGGLLPDLTLILDVPTDVGRRRTGPPRDRIEDRPDDYRERVRRGFLAAAEPGGAAIRIIDADRDPDEVAAQILREARHALGTDPRP